MICIKTGQKWWNNQDVVRKQATTDNTRPHNPYKYRQILTQQYCMRNLIIKQPKNPRVVHPPRHGVERVNANHNWKGLDDDGSFMNEKLITI
jgi:hypothetical protein